MYCPECGFQNSEASNYCSRCGALILPEQPGAQTTMSFAPSDFENETATAPADVAATGPALVIRAGGGRAGEQFALGDAEISIGRSETAGIMLDDVTVSRLHARIARKPDGHWIEDASSLNGTYVNRRRIDAPHLLADGDELQVGKFKLTFLAR